MIPASVPRIVANDADHDQAIGTSDRKQLPLNDSHLGIAVVTAREVVARIEAKGKT